MARLVMSLLILLALGELLFVAGALGRVALAKLAGMRVEAMVFGFGPPLARWGKVQVAAIPLGVFCRVAGCDPCESPVPTDDPRAFHNRPLLLRLLVTLGWPIGAQALLIVFATGVIFLAGVPQATKVPVVAEVARGTPADAAGLRAGDEILSLDGIPVDIAGLVSRVDRVGDSYTWIEVRRGDGIAVRPIRPRLDEGHYRLGIRMAPKLATIQPSFGAVLLYGVRSPFAMQKQTIAGFIELYSHPIEVEAIGPIGMGAVVRQAETRALAARYLGTMGATLVLFSLLPLPPLPGARFWMVLGGWRGPRRRATSITACDADILSPQRSRFPLALLAALVLLGLQAVAGTYHAITGKPEAALGALVAVVLLAGLARGRPRAWSVGVLAPVLFLRASLDPVVDVVSLAAGLTIFATLHLPMVRRYFGLVCPVCAHAAARPVPASRRTACMACGSTWISRR